MLHIKSCKYNDDYKLSLEFDNDYSGTVDLKDLPNDGPVFAPLRDINVFKNLKLEKWGVISWLNGTIDIAPEYLFFLMNKDNLKLHELFKKWGYI